MNRPEQFDTRRFPPPPPMLFREFAAECMELAQTAPTPKKRTLYMKMASVWHQTALRWEKKNGGWFY